jgi:hypothetical protein
MKSFKLTALLILLVFLFGNTGRYVLEAQQGVPGALIQQSPTELRACTPAHADGAINNQQTVTITPPSGQSVYICGLDVSASQNATATANTNVKFTSTNIGGWAYTYSLAATANIMMAQAFNFSQPIKSVIPGTAVTIVSPAALANTAFSINVYYYQAP